MKTIAGLFRGSTFVAMCLAMVFALVMNVLIMTSTALTALAGKFVNMMGMSSSVELMQESLDKSRQRNTRLEAEYNTQKQRNADLEADNRKQKQKIASTRATIKKVNGRIARRTAVAAGRNIASFPAETVPVLGLGLLVANLGLDVSDACATMSDIDEIYTDLNIEPDYGEYQKECVQWGHKLDQYKQSLVTTYQSVDEYRQAVADRAGGAYDNAAMKAGGVYEGAVRATSEQIDETIQALYYLLSH